MKRKRRLSPPQGSHQRNLKKMKAKMKRLTLSKQTLPQVVEALLPSLSKILDSASQTRTARSRHFAAVTSVVSTRASACTARSNTPMCVPLASSACLDAVSTTLASTSSTAIRSAAPMLSALTNQRRAARRATALMRLCAKGTRCLVIHAVSPPNAKATTVTRITSSAWRCRRWRMSVARARFGLSAPFSSLAASA